MTEHYPGSRRILRPGIAAIATLTTSLALLNPVMPVAFADANSTFGIAAQPNVEQEVPESTSALQWGIRNSFVGYVNGATHILDGAKQGPGRTYLWPYQSTTKNPETNEVTIQYGGTVNFLKHCHGGDERPHCDLDFTFGSPKIVINTKTGAGRLYATIHTRDYLSKQWSGPTERHIGNLDAKAGRYNVKDGKMHWRGVSATLTKDGNAAFSNFYEEGGFLDSLSFTLDDTFDIGERSGYNLSDEVVTDVNFDDSNRVFARPDGSILHVTSSSDGKYQLFDKELKSIKAIGDIEITRSSSAGYDPATDSLYWATPTTNKNGVKTTTIKMATVTDGGLKNVTELAQFTGSMTGFTYSPQRNAVSVLHNEGDRTNPQWRMTMVTPAKEVSVVNLPAPATVYPGAEDASELYGSEFGGHGTGLRALPDGTFISLYEFLIRYPNEVAKSSAPVHIKPGAAEGEVVTPISAFDDFMQGSRGNFRGIQVDKTGNIGIYTTFAQVNNASKSTIGFAKYENGQFTMYPAKAHPEAISVAGLSFTPDGKAVFVSQDRSTAVFLDPATMDEIQRASLSSYMKDTASALNDGAVFGADGSLYVLDRRPPKNDDDWREYVGLLRLTPPGSVEQLDPGLTAYTMAGKANEVVEDNDTTKEEENLPPNDGGTKPGDDTKPGEGGTPGDTKPGDDTKPGEGGTPGDTKPGDDTKPGEGGTPGDTKPGEGGTPGDDTKPGDVIVSKALDASKAAITANEKAKAAADEAMKLAEVVKTDKSKAPKLRELVSLAKKEAENAKEASALAEQQQKAANEAVQAASNKLAAAEKALKEAGADESKIAEARATVEDAKKELEAATGQAEEVKKASAAARAAASEARNAHVAADKAAREGQTARPNPDDNAVQDVENEWKNQFQHWLEERGVANPIARVLTFFAGIIQAILFPFIALFGGIR